ncbi:MAG: hypothetical protein QXL85_06990 [Candidatus Bathyarchaeia archaeon]
MLSYKLESGLTFRSFLALLFAIGILGPVTIFITLSSAGFAGAGFLSGGAATYITLLLFTELTSLMGGKMRKQEVFIIFTLSSTALITYFNIFINMAYRAYIRNSPLCMMFKDPLTDLPIPEMLPSWFAPLKGSSAYSVRGLLHPDWAIPIFVALLSTVLISLSEIGLGLLTSYLYVIVEKLPFPLAPIQAETIVTLADRETRKMRIFMIAAMIGVLWCVPFYVLPNIAYGVFGVPIAGVGRGVVFGGGSWIPTYIDLTWYITQVIPGAGLAFDFDLTQIILGFLVPFDAALWMFIGSLAAYFFGNALTLNIKIPEFINWQKDYTPGMSYPALYWRSYQWIWMSFMIGASLAILIQTLIKHRKSIAATFTSLKKLRYRELGEKGFLPLPIILMMIFVGMAGSVLMFKALVPGFPIWTLLVFSVTWPFVNALISSRGQGETGFSISIPLIDRLAVIVSGYKGAEAWYAPIYVGGQSPSFCLMTRVAYLTETNPLNYYKTYFLILPFGLILGFLWVELFWRMAPIPSGLYPGTVFAWAYSAQHTMMYITRAEEIFNQKIMLYGFSIMSIIAAVSSKINIPCFSIMGLMTGLSSPSNLTSSLFFGSIIGRIIQRRVGKEWWMNNRSIIVAGMTTAAGLMIGVTAAIVMIVRAFWPSIF